MTKHTWNLGDTCYADLELKKVVEIENGNVTSVADNYFRTSSSSLNDCIFPNTPGIALISRKYRSALDSINQAAENININHPRIYGWLQSSWVDCCNHEHDDAYIDKNYNDLAGFVENVIREINHAKEVKVNGVKIFR